MLQALNPHFLTQWPGQNTGSCKKVPECYLIDHAIKCNIYQLFHFKQAILKQLFLWPSVQMAGTYLNRVTASFLIQFVSSKQHK